MTLRTYGRTYDEYGNPTWQVVTTDTNGFNDSVYLTALVQCLQLYISESPFWANYGLPAQQAIIQQIMPDFYVNQTQSQFVQYFASLIVSRISDNPPTYNINAITNNGAKLTATVAT